MTWVPTITTWQWLLVVGSSLVMLVLSPVARSTSEFFKAKSGTKGASTWVLTSSLVISWIFAKSITNAANLGLLYGIVGGMAYATYYASFLVAGLIIYRMRTLGGYHSIHHFLSSKFGRTAVVIFSLLIGFRLFNEVWSNTMVIGLYFGEKGTGPYLSAILVFTLLTLAYSLKGGLSSSLFTDTIQMVLFLLLLALVLFAILPGLHPSSLQAEWSMAGGLDLFFVALVQVFSYPFHDPVMTDRGFITDSKTMRRAFVTAVPIGFACILLFSLIGVYAKQLGMQGDATVAVAHTLSTILALAVNFIMITSASSTLDSAFSSFSKLSVIDLGIVGKSISTGRLMMAGLAVLGTLPIFFSPEILSATTVSGTMVIGLAPIFLFWNKPAPRYTFPAVVLIGMAFGTGLAAGLFPQSFDLFGTKYGLLLSINLIGTTTCFLAYLILSLLSRSK